MGRQDLIDNLGTIARSGTRAFGQTLASAKPEMNVLAYSFSRYLQSNTDRMAKYSELLEKIDTGSQIPEPVDLAKIYGFADVASMQADWIAYLNSSSFK